MLDDAAVAKNMETIAAGKGESTRLSCVSGRNGSHMREPSEQAASVEASLVKHE